MKDVIAFLKTKVFDYLKERIAKWFKKKKEK